MDRLAIPLRHGTAPSWDSDAIAQFKALAREASVIDDADAPDRVLIVQALMEALAGVRWEFDRADVDPKRRLRRAYESFRCELARCGMPLEFATQQDRARGHRRLAELAESRGDAFAAVWHYEMALTCWREVGCKRALDRARRLEK